MENSILSSFDLITRVSFFGFCGSKLLDQVLTTRSKAIADSQGTIFSS